MNSAPLLVLAAGGTGGHMFPAQALAEEMLARGWRVKLSTDPRGARYTSGFPDAVEIEVTTSATFARGGLLAKALVPFQIGSGFLSAWWKMRRDRPAVVVGFGGYPSIPALAAAWVLELPRMIHEQNGVLGRVNQLFAKHVDRIACGTWPTKMPDELSGVHTGNPVRAAVQKKANSGYIPPGDYPIAVLVFGGSQGARILSDIVPPALAQMPLEITKHLRVSHQARDEDLPRVQKFYQDNGINAEVAPFFADLPSRMSEAQLVISRAGASSVADISVIGRPSILVPLAAAIRDEQSENARALVASGGAIMMREKDFEVDALCAQLTALMQSPETLQTMAAAAADCGIVDASTRLSNMVANLAEGQTEK